MQIKIVILTICASLAAIGFASPASQNPDSLIPGSNLASDTNGTGLLVPGANDSGDTEVIQKRRPFRRPFRRPYRRPRPRPAPAAPTGPKAPEGPAGPTEPAPPS
ncbi:hypothetical protein BCV72DRAFT_228050 [Rhizopus microsporus var. microsporus]|uniref:Uncharacterized protein n=1 Tax=Rhizopus microsporus var. microsporus TaxID=86635 RepID=A0A1X0R3U1_RHIZD|nr:hypothetical protein BCV72DRAFT_228050 [Rhizopus microsporus var. microsporus]